MTLVSIQLNPYTKLASFQVLGFAAVSGIALHDWISNGGLGGGLGKPGAQTGTGVTLNRCASSRIHDSGQRTDI